MPDQTTQDHTTKQSRTTDLRPVRLFARFFVASVVLCSVSGFATVVCSADKTSSENQDTPLPITATAMADRIDELLADHWQAAGIQPAEIADAATFLRRVSLDLNGITPTVMEVRQFLQSDPKDKASNEDSHQTDFEKRSELVDRLLASPRYATHLANTWRDILLPVDVDLAQIQNVISLQNWLRQQFAQNLPYDTFVAKFLSETESSGPGVFYSTLELKPEKLAAKTSQVFLGVQMQCAECHDHPFDGWSQREFWGYAAFFAQLEQTTEGRRPEVPTVVDRDQGDVMIPESDEVVPPKYPGGRLADPSEGGSRRLQLSIWMASRDNPFLPRAAVNRVWAQMFGRGLVEPIDDMSSQNVTSHPQLLNELAAYFARTGFDLKNLYRTLALTKTYQRASRVDEPMTPADDDPTSVNFARMNIKTLGANSLYDSLERFLSASAAQEIVPGMMLDQRRLQFVSRMRMQTRNGRDFERGAAQSLMLMNGGEMQEITSVNKRQFTAALMSPWLSKQDRVDALFLASVSRFPTAIESATVLAMLDAEQGESKERSEELESEQDDRQVYGDVLWAIVNSGEFTLNH